MTQNHPQPHARELDRLQNIIDVLLEQNAQLKQSLYHCREILNGVIMSPDCPPTLRDKAKSSFYSFTLPNDGVTKRFCHTPTENEGVAKPFCYTPTEKDGVMTPFCYTPIEKDGVSKSFCHIPIGNDGVMTPFCATRVQFEGVKPNFCGINQPGREGITGNTSSIANNYMPQAAGTINNPTEDSGKQQLFASPNPGSNAQQSSRPVAVNQPQVKEISYVKLEKNLNKLTPKSNAYGNENTICILQRLRETSKQSLKDLQMLTGLSEDGIVKRIMMMKKQGLVYRKEGSRNLYLTEKALRIWEESTE